MTNVAWCCPSDPLVDSAHDLTEVNEDMTDSSSGEPTGQPAPASAEPLLVSPRIDTNSAPAPGNVRRAVVGVVAHNGRLLVIRRSEYVRAPGHFCFPGGGVEIGESCAEAVVRELQEELALNVTPHHELWRSVTPSGFELHWWRVSLAAEYRVVPNLAEVAWWGWCTPQQFLKLAPLLPSNQQFMQAWSAKQFELFLPPSGGGQGG